MSNFSSISVRPDPAAHAIKPFDKSPYDPAETAPFNRPLWLEVNDAGGSYRLRFPCLRTSRGFINARTGSLLTVEVMGWRYAAA